MLVNNLLEQSAKLYPDKTALITKEGRYNYRELNEMANKLAHALIECGLKKGDRAAVFMDNSMEAVISIFGILKAGGIFFIVNPTIKPAKLSYILKNCSASALISSRQRIDVISDACKDIHSLKWIYLCGEATKKIENFKNIALFEDVLANNNCSDTPSGAIDADLAAIIYTSGSTGFPKGVMMTHWNMLTAINSITQYLGNTNKDIIINTLPMSFDYGLYQVFLSFNVGATIILEKTFLYSYKVLETIIKENVTGFPIVPTISAILLQLNNLKNYNFDHLRYISNTAAALPVSHINKLKEIFPKTKIFSMYGLTECKRVSYLPPDQLDIRPTSVGKAIPNTETYLVDEQGNKVGPNVIGELIVRGSHVMRGYWDMPDETSKKLRPGPYPGEMALYTGDLFKMDAEGYLYFVARKDDIIKSCGEKVSPKEIENIINGIDGVAETAVVGIDDPVLGQAIKAYVVTSNGLNLTEKDIQRFCAQRLEDIMVPKYVEFCRELPKTDSGKINKQLLSH